MKITAFSGGVGGAKLAVGLQEILPPGDLTVIVNTADDFEHWGLNICPDLDTMMYTLAGVIDEKNGWGRADETYHIMDAMGKIGAEEWFTLGDRDMATHLRRTEWLRQSISLTEVTERLRRSFGVPSTILPMSDNPVQTLVHTDEGDLPFQHYFVRCRCEPMVIDLTYVGADQAHPSEAVLDAIEQADAIIFCPSNPYLSIDPILSVRNLKKAVRKANKPKIKVSNIVGGEAIKGPAAKMMGEMGKDVNPLTVVQHYGDLINGFVLDEQDKSQHKSIAKSAKVELMVTNTVMDSMEIKCELAQSVLDFAKQLMI